MGTATYVGPDFDVSPDWSLTLNETSVAGGTAAGGGVSWTIKGNAVDGGIWNGAFRSEIDPYVTTTCPRV